MEWQPIETAPKDLVGDDYILLWNGRYVCVGQWDDGKYSANEPGWVNSTNCNDFGCAPVEPTHWMPLPEPPTISKSHGTNA